VLTRVCEESLTVLSSLCLSLGPWAAFWLSYAIYAHSRTYAHQVKTVNVLHLPRLLGVDLASLWTLWTTPLMGVDLSLLSTLSFTYEPWAAIWPHNWH